MRMIRFQTLALRRCYSMQNKVLNMGLMTDYLKHDGIVNLLDRNLDEKYLDENIRLRIVYQKKNVDKNLMSAYNVCNGLSKYAGSMNVLRLVLNNIIFDKKPHLHILSMETYMGNDARINPSKEFVTDNDKIIVKWKTCLLNDGIYQVPNDSVNLLKKDLIDSMKNQNVKIQNKHLLYHNDKCIKGKFIFELDENNSKILVNTIENIEIIKNRNYQKIFNLAC